jgi:hypothetical protein
MPATHRQVGTKFDASAGTLTRRYAPTLYLEFVPESLGRRGQ